MATFVTDPFDEDCDGPCPSRWNVVENLWEGIYDGSTHYAVRGTAASTRSSAVWNQEAPGLNTTYIYAPAAQGVGSIVGVIFGSNADASSCYRVELEFPQYGDGTLRFYRNATLIDSWPHAVSGINVIIDGELLSGGRVRLPCVQPFGHVWEDPDPLTGLYGGMYSIPNQAGQSGDIDFWAQYWNTEGSTRRKRVWGTLDGSNNFFATADYPDPPTAKGLSRPTDQHRLVCNPALVQSTRLPDNGLLLEYIGP